MSVDSNVGLRNRAAAATPLNTAAGSGGSAGAISQSSPTRHRRSSALSYSVTPPGSQDLNRAAVQSVALAAQISRKEENGKESWGLNSLIAQEKQKIVPCAPEMVRDFGSSHQNSLEAAKQRKYFWAGAAGISGATGASSYYASTYPAYAMTSAIGAGILTCAGFVLGYFLNKAQSDYSANVKENRDKLCQRLKRQYEKLGKDLITKYIEAPISNEKRSPSDEKGEGNKSQQHERRPSQNLERQQIVDQAQEVVNNWNSILEKMVQKLFIDRESATETALPLYEAALILVNDHQKKEVPSLADTLMYTYFKEKQGEHTIKQIEKEREQEEKARWTKVFEDIQKNKEQVEREAAARLDAAKKEIEKETKRQSEEAAKQIEAARKQATADATSESQTQLAAAIERITAAAKEQAEASTKQFEAIRKQIETEAEQRLSEANEKVEAAILQVTAAQREAAGASVRSEETAKQIELIKQQAISAREESNKQLSLAMQKVERAAKRQVEELEQSKAQFEQTHRTKIQSALDAATTATAKAEVAQKQVEEVIRQQVAVKRETIQEAISGTAAQFAQMKKAMDEAQEAAIKKAEEAAALKLEKMKSELEALVKNQVGVATERAELAERMSREAHTQAQISAMHANAAQRELAMFKQQANAATHSFQHQLNSLSEEGAINREQIREKAAAEAAKHQALDEIAATLAKRRAEREAMRKLQQLNQIAAHTNPQTPLSNLGASAAAAAGAATAAAYSGKAKSANLSKRVVLHNAGQLNLSPWH